MCGARGRRGGEQGGKGGRKQRRRRKFWLFFGGNARKSAKPWPDTAARVGCVADQPVHLGRWKLVLVAGEDQGLAVVPVLSKHQQRPRRFCVLPHQSGGVDVQFYIGLVSAVEPDCAWNKTRCKIRRCNQVFRIRARQGTVALCGGC